MLPLPSHVASPNPEIYFDDNYVVLDFETTNLSFGNAAVKENNLILGVWYDGLTNKTTSIWGNEYQITELVNRIEKAAFIVAQNAKMELGWLRRAGLDLRKVVVYDTMIAEYVIHSNQRVSLSLAEMGPRYGVGTKDPFVDAMMNGGVCPSQIPASFLKRRCEKDVKQTLAIFHKQRSILRDRGLLATFYTRCLLTPCLTDIEWRGMHLDPDATYAEYERATNLLAELEADLNVITGGVNLRSPKQKKKLLYEDLGFKIPKDRKGNDNLSTDHDAIVSLKATNKKQREFVEKYLQYTAVAALVSKNLNFFKGVCDEYSNIFIAQFNQTVARTGRLSSSGVPILVGKDKASVQFQNMPRSLKKLFCARYVADGWQMGEVDGAQLEFRVAGFMGQDAIAYKSIIEGEDVHAFTAEVLTTAGQETDRQGAKPHTFKPLYGGLSGTEAEVTYYTAFRQKYKSITETQEAWKAEVLRTKKLVLPTGLVFYWPDTMVARGGYITNSTNICNYPVQYLATCEIIPIGLVCMWHRMADMESFLVNTIHDSIIGEVHPEEVEEYQELGQHCLTTDVYDYLYKLYGIKFNFPLGTGSKVCRNWAQTKEEKKYESNPPFEFIKKPTEKQKEETF